MTDADSRRPRHRVPTEIDLRPKQRYVTDCDDKTCARLYADDLEEARLHALKCLLHSCGSWVYPAAEFDAFMADDTDETPLPDAIIELDQRDHVELEPLVELARHLLHIAGEERPGHFVRIEDLLEGVPEAHVAKLRQLLEGRRA